MRGARAAAVLLALALPAAAQLDADFTASSTSGVNPHRVDFTDTSTGAAPTLWVWSFGDGGTASTPNPSHTYTAPGSYTVSLTVFDGPFVFDTETKADLIEIAPAPLVPDFTATPTSGPNPLTVDFADTSTGTVVTAWSWDFGDGGTSTEPAPTHTYTAPGSYTVSLTAFFGGQGETVTRPDLISVDPAPLVPDFAATPTSGVNPLTVSFTDLTTGTPPTAWLWDFGDGAISSEEHPSHTYTGDVSYDVSLTVFVEEQSESIVAPDLIQVDPAPLVPIFEVDTLTGAPPLTVSFTGSTTGVEPTGWQWNFGDGALADGSPSVTHTYTEPGTYAVSFSAFFGTQQETATIEELVTVLPFPTLEVARWLDALDGSEFDKFGVAVDVSGNRAVVGAPGFGKFNLGAAYLFDLDTGAQLHKLVGADALVGQDFATPLALDGEFVLVGARKDNTVDQFAGAAYLFDAVSGAQLAKLLPPDGETSDLFGIAVALDGDLALIGAIGVGNAKGAAYLYDLSVPTAPVLVATLSPAGGGPGDGIGRGVALHGARAVVGATGDDHQGLEDAGAAYLFDISNPSQPVEIAKLVDPLGEDDARFGSALALRDEVLLGGASYRDGLVPEAGAVLVFDAATGDLLSEFAAADPAPGDGFGTTVALSGSVALIGRIGGGPSLHDLPSGTQRVRLATGYAAALDGDRAVVGTLPSGAYQFSGSALVYDASLGRWTDLGQGLAGVSGEPLLGGLGPAASGGSLLLGLTDAAPRAAAFLVVGRSAQPMPFQGGVLVPAPDLVIAGLATDAVGDLWLEGALPPGLPAGTAWTLQHWIVDAAGPSGFAASNGLRATTP